MERGSKGAGALLSQPFFPLTLLSPSCFLQPPEELLASVNSDIVCG